MKKLVLAMLVCGAVAGVPVTAGKLADMGVENETCVPAAATLERAGGRSYDVMKLETGRDTVQVLLSPSDEVTVRVNGEQFVLSDMARKALSLSAGRGIPPADEDRIDRMLESMNDPETAAYAILSFLDNGLPMEQGGVAPGFGGHAYRPLAPGGCGIGGACSDEAWAALRDLIGCSGSAGTAVANLASQNYALGLAGTLVGFDRCADWNDSHVEFERCCARHRMGEEPPEEPEIPEICDGCLPPDVEGPNPPCCAE